MVAKLKSTKVGLHRRMHDRMAEVGAWLRKVVPRFPGNTMQLRIFKLRVCRLWQGVLVRRSQHAQRRWEHYTSILNPWIPPPCLLLFRVKLTYNALTAEVDSVGCREVILWEVENPIADPSEINLMQGASGTHGSTVVAVPRLNLGRAACPAREPGWVSYPKIKRHA